MQGNVCFGSLAKTGGKSQEMFIFSFLFLKSQCKNAHLSKIKQKSCAFSYQSNLTTRSEMSKFLQTASEDGNPVWKVSGLDDF